MVFCYSTTSRHNSWGWYYKNKYHFENNYPIFYSHSALSKYFTECIDYILKTEIILHPDAALRVRAATYVNVHGGEGKHKAADMHKENEWNYWKTE